MAVFAQCDLHDAGTLTLLSAHTACDAGTHTVGATWTKVTGAGDVRITAAGRGQPTSSSTCVYVMSPAPADADYTVSGGVYCATDTGQVYLVARQTGASTYYYAGYFKSLARWQISKIVNGTTTQIGTTTALAGLTVGQTYAVQLDVQGTSLTLRVDGVVVAEATDSAITAAGAAGVRVAGSGTPSNESQQYQLASFSADDVVQGAGGGAPGGGDGGTVGSGGRAAATNRAAAAFRSAATARMGNVPVPDTTPPVFTSQPAASNVTDTGAVIGWATDEAATTVVDYGTSASYGTTVTVSGRRTQHAVPLSGLTLDTTYHYRVTTADAAGNATVSEDATFATAAAADTAPPVVTVGPAAGGLTTTGAVITWTTDEPSTSQVEYGTTTSYGTTTTKDTALVTQHSVALTGLSTATGYHYRVLSDDAAGNTLTGADRTFTTSAGADVTAPVVTVGPAATPNAGGATVAWTTDEASDSQVEYGTTASYGSSTTLASALVTSHSVTVTGLAASTLYHYRVKSRDAAGNLLTGSDQTFTTTAPANDITLGALEIYPTYQNIGIRIPYAGDENANATAAVRFKRHTDAEWRRAFDLWSARNGTDRDFRGTVLNCDAGTVYDLEITVTDADGGSAVVNASATTWTDAIPAASSLTPTHYVDSQNGNDATGTGSALAPWRSIQKAYTTAPSGAVVQVKAGYYRPMLNDGDASNRAQNPITLVAEHPSCGDWSAGSPFATPALANAGNHSVVEPQVVAAPTGEPTTDPHGGYTATGVAPWVSETLVGTDGVSYQAWRWAASKGGLSGLSKTAVSQLAYRTTRDGTPQRVGVWDNTGSAVTSTPNVESPNGWIDLVKNNAWYRYGAYLDDHGNAGAGQAIKDLWLVWAGTGTPNDYWWGLSVVGRPALQLLGPNTRVSGLVIQSSDFGLTLGHTNAAGANLPNQSLMTDIVVDHCTFAGNFHGVRPAGRACIDFPSRITIEHCRFLDSNLRAPGPDFTHTNFVVPWQWIKSQTRLTTTKSYSVSKLGRYSETSAIRPNGGVRQLVVRRNLFDGVFNGCLIGSSESTFSRHGHAEIDFYENYCQNMNDDVVEPENQIANWRVWRNKTRWHGPFFSLGPISWGPCYIWENAIWQSGDIGSADFADPATEANSVKQAGSIDRQYVSPNGAFFKGGGISSSQPIRAALYTFNNTYWSDAATVGTVTDPYTVGSVILDQLASSLQNFHYVYARNNVWMASKRVYHIWSQSAQWWDADYNAYGSVRTTGGGVVVENVKSYDSAAVTGSGSIADLRTYHAGVVGKPDAYGNDDHSNHFGGSDANLITGGKAVIDAALTDPENGDLTLAVGSAFSAAGEVVPGFERPGIDFEGSAPNVGYTP